MRPTALRLGAPLLVLGLLAAGCGDDDDASPAEDAQAEVCEDRNDVSNDMSELVAAVEARNFGDARDELGDIGESLSDLAEATSQLTQAQRDEVQPQVDAIQTAIGDIDPTQVDSIEESITAISAEVDEAVDAIGESSALDCP
jgi:ABC-type transporter Mla subunit MlaD